MARKINAAGLELVKSFEGLRLDAYRCAAGVLTIGWGSTGPHVKEGMTISLEEAETLLKTDLARFERIVERATADVPTSDDQFSAMTSLCFNIGPGDPKPGPHGPISGFLTSTVLKRHRLGNYLGASRAFLLWNKAKGQVLKGLTRRREAEAKLYRSEA
jgi:lysozyme